MFACLVNLANSIIRRRRRRRRWVGHLLSREMREKLTRQASAFDRLLSLANVLAYTHFCQTWTSLALKPNQSELPLPLVDGHLEF